MQFRLDHTPLNLTDGTLLHIRAAEGRSLRVLTGRVWITQEGSLDDIFLNAGESHTFAGSGSAVVTPESRDQVTATVLFDVPLTVQARSRVKFRWLDLLGASWHPTAHA